MNNIEQIKVISTETEFKLKEKGSIFIAKSFPVISEDEIIKILTSIKKEYYDATHHCYSYKLQNGIFKYSDDGEPNGTAGLRIYNAQNHFELTNILTVVTRYFGGTKLGVGPLGKAYYESALGSLQNSKIITKELYQFIILEYDFTQSKTVHHFISKYEIKILKNEFENSPKIFGIIKANIVNHFKIEIDKFSPKIICTFENKFDFF